MMSEASLAPLDSMVIRLNYGDYKLENCEKHGVPLLYSLSRSP